MVSEQLEWRDLGLELRELGSQSGVGKMEPRVRRMTEEVGQD